jgi:hypothetical protein
LLNLNPDVALLQEMGSLPPKIKDEFGVCIRPAIKKAGGPSGSSTGVLVKGEILGPVHLPTGHLWVNNELSLFAGHLVACVVQMNSGEMVNVISVYSPAWYVSPARLAEIDVSKVARTFNKKSNRKVYVTDLVWAALKDNFSVDQSWIVGGDFNTSENLPRSSPEFLNRMRGLGLTECLRPLPDDPIIPTFCHSNGRIDYQLDHLFVSPNFRSQLRNCTAGDHAEIISRKPQRLSDHLPIIADFADCAESTHLPILTSIAPSR